MKQINFNYSSNSLSKVDIDEFIDLHFELNNNIPFNNPYYENTMTRWRSSKFKSLEDVRKKYQDSKILKYLEPSITQAQKHGILGCYDFNTMMIGNHPRLPKKDGIVKHFHRGSTPGIDCNIYTIVYPLLINNPVTEYVWMHWVEHDHKTVDFDNLIRTPEDHQVVKDMRAFAIQDRTRPEIHIPFPSANEQLTFEFNGTHWLHSVENSKDNIYFVVAISDTRE